MSKINYPDKTPGAPYTSLNANEVKASVNTLYLTNVVYINSPSDFPAAIGGLRELSQPGINMVYEIASTRMDMGTDLFTVTSGNVTIKGANVFGSAIASLGVGDLFKAVDSSLVFDSILWDCPNATVIDFSVPTATTISLLTIDCIVINCDKIANMSGSFTSSFKTMTIFQTQTGGFLWTGANNQLHIPDMFANSWTGTLLDLGTATFNLALVTGGRFLSPVGTTILNGASGSANLNAGARGLVDINLFNGLGTSISGIDTMDLQWDFSGNTFADGTTLNTRQVADAFLTSTQTVTIGGIGTFVAIGGANWSSDIDDRFTVGTDGIITYIGLGDIEIEVLSFSTIELTGGGADKLCTKIAIDSGGGFIVSDKTMGCTENNTPSGVSSAGLFAISNGDKIQTFVGNMDSTGDIDVSESMLIVKGG